MAEEKMSFRFHEEIEMNLPVYYRRYCLKNYFLDFQQRIEGFGKEMD